MPLPRRLAAVLVLLPFLFGCLQPDPGERSGPATGSRAVERAERSSRSLGGERWSDTAPPINLSHLFEGQINRRGKPVGFHARPGGVDPGTARVVRVIDRPNRAGVYVARVEIRDRSGRWLGKTSTFYPDALSEDDVVAAVLAAFRGSRRSEKWRGDSGRGFTIEGYYQDGRINTAYPIFR